MFDWHGTSLNTKIEQLKADRDLYRESYLNNSPLQNSLVPEFILKTPAPLTLGLACGTHASCLDCFIGMDWTC